MTTPASDPYLSVRAVRKEYEGAVAVDAVSLDVAEGEFVSLLGPSGSGKTTTLMMIAGFVEPDAGGVHLAGRDLTRVPPHRRNIGVVFQHYALFPHMSVAANVMFPLKMRGVRKGAATIRMERALARVQLSGFEHRYPAQLSGGQQQRVALARALVFDPELLLMDEPLGALDKKLRAELQVEIGKISRELGVTVVYVTHDQEEALAMSDRIAIYDQGRIAQIGNGRQLYEHPESLFVARFMGESNVFSGTLLRDQSSTLVRTDSGVLKVRLSGLARQDMRDGAEVCVVVRPEDISIVRSDDAASGELTLTATVTDFVFLGAMQRVTAVLAGGQRVTISQSASSGDIGVRAGDEVELCMAMQRTVVLANTNVD